MIAFREIRKEDDPIIAGIIRHALKDHHLDIPGTAYFDTHLDYLSEYYVNQNGRLYVMLEEDNKIIGGIGMAEFEGFSDCAELQKLYLIDEAKGRGLGKQMVKYIENAAKAAGYKHLYLETHSNLQAAIGLYRKTGFREIPRPEFVGHSTMDTFFIKEL